MWNGEIKVITGIRRCGKSVLLFDLFFEYLLSQNVPEDHILKIALDQRFLKYKVTHARFTAYDLRITAQWTQSPSSV